MLEGSCARENSGRPVRTVVQFANTVTPLDLEQTTGDYIAVGIRTPLKDKARGLSNSQETLRRNKLNHTEHCARGTRFPWLES